jgi:hypothetical protein
MSVYVDGERNSFGRMKMCHMIADTLEELHDMAQRIGLRREWFQKSRSGMPHYDVCQSKRALAVKLGAVEINRRQLVELVKKHRENAAWERYGGCTCMGHGECNFCRERQRDSAMSAAATQPEHYK